MTNSNGDLSPSALKELAPLAPAIVAMVVTNRAEPLPTRIGVITNAPITRTEKAQALLLIQTTLEREDQRRLAHTIVPYVEDSAYLLIRKQLLNAQLHPQILSVFMTDTLKRKNGIKLPVLLALARDNTHPMKTEALQLLGTYLGQDYGTNWVKWDEAAIAWLKKNPK